MRKRNKTEVCISCGMSPLSKDEVGINLKLLGDGIANYFCLSCLSDYLEVSEQDILDKIEEFKAEGCKLFD